MLDMVNARQLERFGNYRTHILKRWFPITTLKYPAFVGSFSITSKAINQRWVLQKHAYKIGHVWVTPADIARDYLAIKYDKRKKRMTTAQWRDQYLNKRQSPIYSLPSRFDMGYYIDVKSAYWSILRAVGWDVDYHAGRWLSVGSRVDDFPTPDIKMSRNSLVSVGLPSKLRMWTGSEFVFLDKPNPFINIQIWTLAQDVLNGIADDMVNAGAVYAYTDGFIVPDSEMNAAVAAIERWGMSWSIKARGAVHVKAPAAYKVGDYESSPYIQAKERHRHKIHPRAKAWLRERIRFFSERVSNIT